MRRRSLWILAVILVLVIGGAVALVLTQKPSLDDARDAVDTRWDAVRPALEARYEKLDAARASFVDVAGGDRTVTADLQRELDRWRRALDDRDAVAAGRSLEPARSRRDSPPGQRPRLSSSQPVAATARRARRLQFLDARPGARPRRTTAPSASTRTRGTARSRSPSRGYSASAHGRSWWSARSSATNSFWRQEYPRFGGLFDAKTNV